MATTPSVVIGAAPVPFKDFVAGDQDAAQHEEPLALREHAGVVSALPSNPKLRLRCYQGTWVLEQWVPGIIAIQHGGFFTPRHSDVVLASMPKCGSVWLKALAFATMARSVHPPAAASNPKHPLLRLSPDDCVPSMEMLFATERGSKAMEAVPSPRLMATHMQHSVLPPSVCEDSLCKIVYICREPKDMLVSMWQFARRFNPDLQFSDLFEAACEGSCLSGPIWDHVLGYWNASRVRPEKVLFLRYEEMLRDPVSSVVKLSQFLGQPFSPAEEEGGVVMDVLRLCSSYSREGEAGEWSNHMTPEMARLLDAVVEERLRGSGFSFA